MRNWICTSQIQSWVSIPKGAIMSRRRYSLSQCWGKFQFQKVRLWVSSYARPTMPCPVGFQFQKVRLWGLSILLSSCLLLRFNSKRCDYEQRGVTRAFSTQLFQFQKVRLWAAYLAIAEAELLTVSIPKGAIMSGRFVRAYGIADVSIPKGAIMSSTHRFGNNTYFVVSIPKGAIMSHSGIMSSLAHTGFNSKRCDYEEQMPPKKTLI